MGEKKFLGELCELRNFREGYKKYKTLDRATECAIVCVADKKGKIKMNKNNLLPKQPNNPVASPETNHSPLTIHHSPKRIAFTLAEVLITLGIIGVVASMTLPSVINNYKIKQLRTGFLRSSSMIQNTLNQTANEFGYSNYKELNSICGNVRKADASACKKENEALFKEINADFLSRFKGLKSMKSRQFWPLGNTVKNFSGTTKLNYGNLYGVTGWSGTHASAYLISDGTMVSSIAFYYHEPSDGLSISFDTNGPYKGPNRYGYDIFLFNTGTWYKFCSQKSDGLGGLYNGRGCYDYALKDVNPDDNTKGYWESLK